MRSIAKWLILRVSTGAVVIGLSLLEGYLVATFSGFMWLTYILSQQLGPISHKSYLLLLFFFLMRLLIYSCCLWLLIELNWNNGILLGLNNWCDVWYNFFSTLLFFVMLLGLFINFSDDICCLLLWFLVLFIFLILFILLILLKLLLSSLELWNGFLHYLQAFTAWLNAKFVFTWDDRFLFLDKSRKGVVRVDNIWLRCLKRVSLNTVYSLTVLDLNQNFRVDLLLLGYLVTPLEFTMSNTMRHWGKL